MKKGNSHLAMGDGHNLGAQNIVTILALLEVDSPFLENQTNNGNDILHWGSHYTQKASGNIWRLLYKV